MHRDNSIYFIINGFLGGGAERVMELLASIFADKGYDVTLVLVTQSKQNAETNMYIKSENVRLFSLVDNCIKPTILLLAKKKVKSILARVCMRVYEKTRFSFFEKAFIENFVARNYYEIKTLQKLIGVNDTVVAFLDKPIQMALYVGKKVKAKVTISERVDPNRHSLDPTALAFIKYLYSCAEHMIFQTTSASTYYDEVIGNKGVVIPNPIMAKLPEMLKGTREKIIVNFCRISPPKNLPLLLRAFALFSKEYPEYILRIYGDAYSEDEKLLLDELKNMREELGMRDKVEFHGFKNDIHDRIKNYAMFVSSSDFEGMSNSMIEAIAMGLPTICTDCPAGGARDIIEDGGNGLLVPVNDPVALSEAMKKIASSEDLSRRLSKEGYKLRKKLDANVIVNKWEEVLFLKKEYKK